MIKVGSYVELEYAGRGFITDLFLANYVRVKLIDGNVIYTKQDNLKILN